MTEWHPDRKAALAAESEAIKTEWPLYNIKGSIGGHGAVPCESPDDARNRHERVNRALWGYANPDEELNRLIAQLAADEDLCARTLALFQGGGS